MSEELYNSDDFCKLAEQYEELKKENDELTADKIRLIQAAIDDGGHYHYTAHDIGYRDLERKVKALEADYIISNRELLILQAELDRLKEENHALDQINRDIQTAAAHLDEVSAELARRDEIIARLKEDAERLAETHIYAARYGDTNCIHCARVEDNGNIDHKTDCPITLHRSLMKELE